MVFKLIASLPSSRGFLYGLTEAVGNLPHDIHSTRFHLKNTLTYDLGNVGIGTVAEGSVMPLVCISGVTASLMTSYVCHSAVL